MDWHVWLTIVLPRPHAILVKRVCLLHAKGMSNIVCVCVSTDELCRCDISRLRVFLLCSRLRDFLFDHVCDILFVVSVLHTVFLNPAPWPNFVFALCNPMAP